MPRDNPSAPRGAKKKKHAARNVVISIPLLRHLWNCDRFCYIIGALFREASRTLDVAAKRSN